MSTTNTTTSATSSSSSPGPSSSQADTDTATLYLFTFLVTILTLVLLSASLVVRSYILRRRYRQRFQQAFVDGLFDLDRPRRSTRRLGPKPVVWDTWIHTADKDPFWSSITPVAVRCSPLLSPPSSVISSPPRSVSHPDSPPSRLAIFSPLRIPSFLSLSSRPSLLLPTQAQSPIGSPIPSSTRSPPPARLTSPDPSTRTDKDAAALSVCVLVAMPDAAAPVHRPAPDTEGKSVRSPTYQQSGDALPLLPSSPRRSGPRTVVERDTPPLLEFGVARATTGEWAWRS